MTLHAKLSASGAHRWMACPGSVAAEEGLPDRSSSFAEEGTRAHELMEQTLLEPELDCVDFMTDKEMVNAVQLYVDYVRGLKARMDGAFLFIERRVDFSEWVPNGFGTADTILCGGNVMHIVDLKYGKGVQVFAENNPQALLYALGAYDELNFIQEIETIRISIVQPRLDHISEWELSVTDLLKFGETARNAANEAMSSTKRVPGVKQCQFCKAKATCPALYKLTSDTLMADFDQLDEIIPVNKLTDDQMSAAIENRPLIEAWLSAVENLAKERIANGNGFGGYKLVEGRANRKWADETIAAERLSKYTNEEIYTRKLVTPAQAEKILGKKDKAKIEDLITKPRGTPTLAKESDPRPEIKATISDFEAIDEE